MSEIYWRLEDIAQIITESPDDDEDEPSDDDNVVESSDGEDVPEDTTLSVSGNLLKLGDPSIRL